MFSISCHVWRREKLLNMRTIHGRSRCGVRFDEKVTNPFLFEEPAVTGDTFLAMKNTTSCHVPMGSFPVRWCTTSLLPS
jgi:hypothetical protein